MRIFKSSCNFTWTLLALLAFTGCSAPTVSIGDDDDGDPMSAEEKRAVEAARPFMTALVRQDLKSAYDLLSSHAKGATTFEQFIALNDKNMQQFGKPLRLEEVLCNEIDADILHDKDPPAGTDPLEAGFIKIEISRAIGEMPSSLAAGLRKASVSGDVIVKPPAVKPGEGNPAGTEAEKPDPGEADEPPTVILTVVLVEDGGQLRVGYFFYRFYDILD